MNPGIFPIQELKAAAAAGWIKSPPFDDAQFQPASLDLRLGNVAYRIRSSFLPQDRRVEEVLAELSMYRMDLTNGGILERGSVYLIPLLESLSLPENVMGRTNPKSSTGRMDVFTRVITDFSRRFEEIYEGYSGQLYLEVVPRSFTVRVEPGLSLNQLRLFTGQPRLDDKALIELYRREPLLFDEQGRPIPIARATQTRMVSDSRERAAPAIIERGGLSMTIDLKGDRKHPVVGYKARRNSAVVDLTRKAAHRASEYWEPVMAGEGGHVILEPEEFYIFASRERVRVPPRLAAEMVEYDAGSGELRTHYAGFFDPGFGYRGTKRKRGTRAVLEVRAHDVPFRIEHGQVFFKLVYEEMADRPDFAYGRGSHYQDQGLALSKHFH
jgi:dCTP deaminase